MNLLLLHGKVLLGLKLRKKDKRITNKNNIVFESEF